MNKQRHSIRLKNYDYSQSGLYFTTICTQNRLCIFGDMELNEMGKIVANMWESLPKHHPVELDAFQIMPNHVHFIIQIVDSGGSRRPEIIFYPKPVIISSSILNAIHMHKEVLTLGQLAFLPLMTSSAD